MADTELITQPVLRRQGRVVAVIALQNPSPKIVGHELGGARRLDLAVDDRQGFQTESSLTVLGVEQEH
jgi:hypothetical protein